MKKIKRIGFTLVELLVVIAIIALLMGVLMPALAKVRAIAYRMVCGTNLSAIGKAMLLYSNDYGDYPIAGKGEAPWSIEGKIANWYNQERRHYGVWGDPVSVTSSFYLLIKYDYATPKLFVCRGDVGTKVFKLSDAKQGSLPAEIVNLEQVWDFGSGEISTMASRLVPGQYCSYSYHLPYVDDYPVVYGRFNITPEFGGQQPLCADRNPYLDKNANAYIEGQACVGGEEDPPTWITATGTEPGRYEDVDRTGNAAAHGREGQNVLFNDGHVVFARYPNIGINNDNIWKCWGKTVIPTANVDKFNEYDPHPYCNLLKEDGDSGQHPWAIKDAFLVGERNEETCSR